MKDACTRLALFALLVSSLPLAACSILAPVPDASHFFVLAPLPRAPTPPNADESQSSATLLGIGPIKLPLYLDRQEIAMRLSPTQVGYSDVDRWAEPLGVSVNRVLMQNLSLLLGAERIVMYPWSNAANVSYQLEIELLSFEATQQGEAQLLARYTVLEGGTRRPLLVRDAAIHHPTATDTGTTVATLSTVLGELSQVIAATVHQLPKPQEAPDGISATRQRK